MPSHFLGFAAEALLTVFILLSSLLTVCYYVHCVCIRLYHHYHYHHHHHGHHQDIEFGHPRNPPDHRIRGGGSQTFLEVCWRSDFGDDKITRECVICLDEFSDGDECKVGSKCEHIFHKYCIDKWLPKNRQCPLCRLPAWI